MEKQKSYGIIEWVMKMKSFNYEEMFAQSIGLQEPWRVERVEYDEEKREVHIYVKARKTSKYPCPECGKMCARYDDEEEERIWRHGDVCFFHVMFTAGDQGSNAETNTMWSQHRGQEKEADIRFCLKVMLCF